MTNGGEGVLDRGREGVLRREPVVDREHQRRDLAGEEPARLVVGVEVADHVAAAVVVDDAAGRGARRSAGT